jgi:hypothetical protein
MVLSIAGQRVKIEWSPDKDIAAFHKAILPFGASDTSAADFTIAVSREKGIQEKTHALQISQIRINAIPANPFTAIVSRWFTSRILWPEKKMLVSIDTESKQPELLILENVKLLISLLCIQKGGLPCHSSAVSKNQSGVAFVGHSGSGKSTIAAKMSLSWSLIDDDFNIFMPENGSFFVHATPFYLLSKSREFKKLPAPVRLEKIFILQKGMITKTVPVSFQQKFIFILGNTFAFSISNNFGETIMDNCRHLCETVPIEKLFFCKSDDLSLKMNSFLGEKQP